MLKRKRWFLSLDLRSIKFIEFFERWMEWKKLKIGDIKGINLIIF